MRERLLTRHFVQRFLENDLVSPDSDRHGVLSLVFGGLLSCTMFITIVVALKFLFMPLQSPGRTALLAVDDRLLFMACTMIVMALVAVTSWDGLGLDPRDSSILGHLPIRHGVDRPRQVEGGGAVRLRFRAGGDRDADPRASAADGRQAVDRVCSPA